MLYITSKDLFDPLGREKNSDPGEIIFAE